jgi:hypothetical protein
MYLSKITDQPLNRMKRLSQFFRTALLILFMSSIGPVSLVESSSPFAISIISPGENSTVVSPIDLVITIQPADIHLIRISLITPDNTLLARQLLRLDSLEEDYQVFNSSIAFEIPAEQSQALLSVEMLDTAFRPISVRSSKLILQSSGIATILPPAIERSWLTLTAIIPLESTNGGQITVQGSLTPLTAKPVHFELFSDTGRLIGAKQLAVQSVGDPFDFIITIPITQMPADGVSLVVRQTIDLYLTNIILDRFFIEQIP